MKAILEFNLPEDQVEFDLANQSLNYYSALHEITQQLRSIWKYEELTDKEFELIERVRGIVSDILISNQINLNK